MRRALKKSSGRDRRLVPYAQAGSLAILYAADEAGDLSFLPRLVNQIRRDGKEVSLMGYSRENKAGDGEATDILRDLCHKKDFGLAMNPRSDELKRFVLQPVDILVDLSPVHMHPLKQLAALSMARFKTGMSHPDHRDIFDLMLEVEQDCTPAQLSRHMFHYLKILKTPGSS